MADEPEGASLEVDERREGSAQWGGESKDFVGATATFNYIIIIIIGSGCGGICMWHKSDWE